MMKMSKADIKELKGETQKESMIQSGNLKSGLERLFLDRFNEISTLTKNKDIKMFRCTGDPTITKEETSEIVKERQDFHNRMLCRIRDEGVHRYEKIIDSDLPIYEPIMPFYQATWDQHKNNPNKLRKMRMAKFMRCATKVIL